MAAVNLRLTTAAPRRLPRLRQPGRPEL